MASLEGGADALPSVTVMVSWSDPTSQLEVPAQVAADPDVVLERGKPGQARLERVLPARQTDELELARWRRTSPRDLTAARSLLSTSVVSGSMRLVGSTTEPERL